jgi:lipoyl(octanoyl) transferase
VKELVRRLEQAAIDVLAGYGIDGERRAGMPGVYVDGAKIAAIGLRIARGCSYHGLAINVDADLEPSRVSTRAGIRAWRRRGSPTGGSA